MLLANRRASRLSHETSWGSYSKPAPGPLMVGKVADVKLVLFN